MIGGFKILICLSILYIIHGCSSIPGKIQADRMKQIKTMSILNVVIYVGPWIFNKDLSGQSGGSHGNAIRFARDSDSNKFRKYLEKNKIIIDEIIKSEITKQFNQFTNIKHTETERSDVSLIIYVNYYGYTVLDYESGYQRPTIQINMEVLDKNNQVIARIYASRSNYEFIRKFTYNDLFSHPDRVRKSLEFTVEQAISDLISNLDEV